MGLREWLCRRAPKRGDDTRRLIAESEKTRVELHALAVRLGVYVEDLRAKAQNEMRQQHD